MAAQPFYPDQLNLALDRLFARVTTYVDARFDGVMTQMRIDRQEAQAAIQQVRAEIQQVRVEIQEIKTEQVQFSRRLSDVEIFQKTLLEAIKAQSEDILQVVRTLHAEAMEGINELRQRGNR